MRALLIFNPAAGQRDMRAAVAEVVAHLQATGWQVALRETYGRGDATTYAREAVAERLDAVFAVGGDGTLNEVVNGLAHSPVALGVLPTGTANVWAQEIGLPVPRLLSTDPNPLLTCVQQLAVGETRTMDLGTLNGRYFMLYGSVGFDAHIVREMEQQRDLKARLGGLAYFIAGAAAAWNFIGTRTLIVADGKKMRRRIWAVMAANTQLYGGLLRIAADALADDGMLDVVIVEGHGPLATLRHYSSFLLQGFWADPQVEFLRARTIEVHPHRPLPVQVDGDPSGSTPVRIEAAPRALRVLVPGGAALPIFHDESPLEVSLV